tara:strand:+ start:1928 stop:2377 length:450 start_codon:yes stop_codon:yes gene_type:complete
MNELELISDKIFKIHCIYRIDNVESNLKDFPNNKEIKKRICNILRSKEKILFPKLLNLKKDILYVSKNQKFKKIPIEVEHIIFSYLDFGFNIEDLIKNILKNNFRSKLVNIITENKFDLTWYDFGSIDYRWASNTIDSANKEIKILNLI